MGTIYTSTIHVNVWKEHTCVRCGRVFRYLFQRKIAGQGGTPAKAAAKAQAAVGQALAHETDLHPCPGCGLYQADMIGSRKARLYRWMIAVALVLVALPVILYAADLITSSTAAYLAAALGAALVGVQWRIGRSNLNRDLEANHRLAQTRVEKGELWVPQERQTSSEVDESATGSGWTAGHTTVYAMMLLGLLAFLSPEGIRAAVGWRTNPEWVPLVAGPGDAPYIYFPDQITSVKGFWRGRAEVKVTNWKELGLKSPLLQASSKTDNWGNEIQIGSKESKTSTSTLWLRVQLPPDGGLEGKTLYLDLGLIVEFPELMGANQWHAATYEVRPRRKTLQLSSAGAGGEYRSWWWGGFLGGAFLLVVPSLALVPHVHQPAPSGLAHEYLHPGPRSGRGRGNPRTAGRRGARRSERRRSSRRRPHSSVRPRRLTTCPRFSRVSRGTKEASSKDFVGWIGNPSSKRPDCQSVLPGYSWTPP